MKQLPLRKQTAWLVDPRGPFGIYTAPFRLPFITFRHPSLKLHANFLFWQGLDSIKTKASISQVHNRIRTFTTPK